MIASSVLPAPIAVTKDASWPSLFLYVSGGPRKRNAADTGDVWDATGNNAVFLRHGAVSFTNGARGKVLSGFDGTQGSAASYVTGPAATITGPFTVSAACAITALPATAGGIVGQAATIWSGACFALRFVGSLIAFDTGSTGTSMVETSASASAYADGKMRTYHGVWDGAIKRLYVDGKLVASDAWSGPIFTSTAPVTLGVYDGSNRYSIAGSIGGVKIFNYPLTTSQIFRDVNDSNWRLRTQTLTRVAAQSGIALNPLPAYVATDGSMTATTFGGVACLASGPAADATVRFRGTLPGLKLTCQSVVSSPDTGGSCIRVEIDGVDSGTAYAGSNGVWETIQLGTTYDNTAEHEYTIHGGNGQCYFSAIDPTGGTINTATIAAKPTLCGSGDSIAKGTIVTHDNGVSWLHLLGKYYGCGVANLGVNGEALSVITPSVAAARVLALSPAPAIVICGYGHNDAALAGYAVPASTFQTNYTTYLQALITGLPGGTRIYCVLYFPSQIDVGAGVAVRTAYKAAIQAAIAACTGTTNVYFLDTDNWQDISGGTPDLADGIHQSAAGSAKIKTKWLAATTVVASPPAMLLAC